MNFLDKLSKMLPFGKKEEAYEYFFGLNISQKNIIGCVWGIENKHLRIINTSTTQYETEEDLVEAANFVLDQALGEFQPEPTKILFGVPDEWLQDEDLKPDYLKTLKNLVKELDVVPMAYVATSHSITHLLQKQTGAPVTAILIQITNPLTVTVVKGGKIVGSKTVKRSENLPKDIEKVLLTFSDIEVLPSRILIYGAENLNKFKEELLAFSWMSQLPFLHLPKIEELDKQIVIQAISFAGASEVDPEIRLHKHDLEMPKAQNKGLKQLEEDHVKGRRESAATGFVAGDIAEVSKEDEEMARQMMMNDEDLAGEMDIDVYGHESPAKRGPHHVASEDRDIETGIVHSGPKTGLPGRFLTGGVMSILKLLIIPVILVAGIGIFLYLQKADVTIFVDLRTLEKEATVTADPNVTTVDEANRIIPGKIVETDVTTTGKGSASGKKKVGDPSKGAVIVYNKTASQKTFGQGTVLVGPNNLKFTLDSQVNIASQSAVEGGISFGKATANVTASDIGPDGNLPAGQEMTVQGQDANSFTAKVDTAFSGGVSKDVTIVTSDDQKKLLAEVLSEARKKAREELQGKMTEDFKVLEEGMSEKIIKQAFTKNVGDQASEFNLNLTVNLKGTAYKDGDLKSFVTKLVETNVPDGYELDMTKTETQADVSKLEKDGKLVFSAKYRAKLMPKLNLEQLKKDIAFKSIEDASTRIRQIENVIGSNIDVRPNLPGPLRRLPVLPNNIKIEVQAK